MNGQVSLLLILQTSLIVCQQLGQEQSYWKNLAKKDLEESLDLQLNTNVAKNVILFIGDGMGPNTITAARIHKGGETSYLSWERFPHIGGIKTYSANKQVPDSASTACAMFTEVKINYRLLGLDSSVNENDCPRSMKKEVQLKTIASLAQEQGKATGFVTTTRVTHATPAALYARSASRKWECDNDIPDNFNGMCKDIGRQLIEDDPGKSFNVIMGGGRQVLMTNATGTLDDPIDTLWSCKRTDGRNLMEEWSKDKKSRNLKYAFVNNTQSLLDVDTSNTDYLMGIFANSHLELDYKRNTSGEGMPSQEQMTLAAIKVLMNNNKGFLLMVEGGLIDQAHHRGKARKAIHETVAFDDAINATMNFLEAEGIIEETLVIVTSDHSHTLTISGYPARGNSIFGISQKSKEDGMPYTTLNYANSGKENYHYVINGTTVVRENPTTVNTSSFEYGVQAAILENENTHGGSDVFVYASGPYAHLFHRMHEQNYIATVIKYAARLGEYANRTSSAVSHLPSLLLISSVTLISLSIKYFS